MADVPGEEPADGADDAPTGDGLAALREALTADPVSVEDDKPQRIVRRGVVPAAARGVGGLGDLTRPGSALGAVLGTQNVITRPGSALGAVLGRQNVLTGPASPIGQIIARQSVLTGPDSPIGQIIARQSVLTGPDSPIGQIIARQSVLTGPDSPIGQIIARQSVLTGPDSPIGQIIARQSSIIGPGSAIASIVGRSSALGGGVVSAVQGVFGQGAAVRAVADVVAGSNLRLLDTVVPSAFAGAELAATARLARLVRPAGVISAWRGSLLAEHVAAGLADSASAGGSLREVLAGLDRSASVAARLSGLAVGSRAAAGVWPSALPASLLGEYVGGFGTEPSPVDAIAGAAAGMGVAGLLAVDILARPEMDSAGAVVAFEDDVAGPWVDGPARARAELMDALAAVDPDVPDLLDGAWVDVEQQGPGAVVKIAACTVEALERTLRALAPAEEVLAWHQLQGRPPHELHDGKPTHALRIRFVLREDRRGRLAAAQADAVAVQVGQLRSVLQAGKHASAGAVSSLRAHLLSVEAVLHQLVADR